jgi:CRP/FNR family transcriptional regulator, cyclic AMP receptor protein
MRSKDSKLDQLGRVRLFRACSKKELTTIGRASDEVRVSAGKTLCEEGAAGHEFYLILDGKASVKRGGRKVATLGPGDYFGELALLDRGAPRNATVVADTDMELVVLGQREFSGVLDEVPGIAHKLLGSMAQRLREADSRDVGH